MFKLRKLATAVPVTVLVAGATMLTAAPAFADASTTSTTSTDACTIKVDGTTNDAGNATSKFQINGDETEVSTTLVLSGDAQCTATVSLASWEAPNGTFNSANIVAQTLFDHTTATFGPGTHTISAKMNNCFYQFDLVHGASATAPDGTPVYSEVPGMLISWAQGGNTTCSAPVTPVVPVTPIPPAAPAAPAPAALPNTGAGNVIGLFSASAVAGTVLHWFFVSRRATRSM